MLPAQPPPPTNWNFPFQFSAGIQASSSISESADGLRIAFTRQYDIITMLHVLEHTSNPLSTLRRAKELLNDNGYLVVVVPNYQSLDSRIKDILSRFKLKKRPYKHLALGHHNYIFSIKSLELLGEKAGLRIVHRETRQPAWRASRWHRLMKRYRLATWCWIVYQKFEA